jgi:hypothetical protein
LWVKSYGSLFFRKAYGLTLDTHKHLLPVAATEAFTVRIARRRYYRHDEKQRAAMVTKEILFPSVSTPSKNRTSVGVSSTRQRRLATTALLGLAPVRSARASAADHRGKHQRSPA